MSSLLEVARVGPWAPKAPLATVTPSPRGMFPEAQSPAVSHTRSLTGKRDVPAPVAFSSFLLTVSDVVGGGGQQL